MGNLPITQGTPLQAPALPGLPSAAEPDSEVAFGEILGQQLAGGTESGTLLPGELAALSTALSVQASATQADISTLPQATDAATSVAIGLPNDMLALLLPQQMLAQGMSQAVTADAPSASSGTVMADSLLADSRLSPVTVPPLTSEPSTHGNTLPTTSDKDAALFTTILTDKGQTAALSRLDSGAESGTPSAQSLTPDLPSTVPLSSPLAAPATNGNLPQIPAHASVQTPVAHPGWTEEFGQKITWLMGQKEQSAELHLNPAQLGPVDVVLKVQGDQASVQFSSPHAAVREAIEQALPRLRDMLQESGITLEQANVSDQSAQRDQAYTPRQQHADSGLHAGLRTEEVGNAHREMRVSTINRHNGIVDTFV